MADAGMRVQAVGVPELRRLFPVVEATGDRNLSLWLAAVSAEHHIWQGDLTGVAIAQAGLVDAEHATRSIGRVARGRLRRIMALAALLTGAAAQDAADAVLADAIADLEGEGQVEELAITTGLMAAMRVISGGQMPESELPAIRRALDTVRLLESDRVPLVCLGLAWSAAIAWNFAAVDEALAEVQEVDETQVGPVVADLLGLVRLAAELEQHGATPQLVDATHERFALIRRRFIVVPSAALFIAVLLLDSGDWEAAQELVDMATGSAMQFTALSENSARELKARLRLLRDRDTDGVAELLVAVDQWVGAGLPRHAADACLRGALDCVRAGFPGKAGALHKRGVELLPAERDRSPWETSLLARYTQATTSGVNAGGGRARELDGELLVMGDDLVVRRCGAAIELTGVTARLLVLLVAQRRPVGTDWIIETLWPEVDPLVGRNRLKANLWRLRKQLELDHYDLVARTSKGVELVPGHAWRVDLWEFYDLAAGNDTDRIDAVEGFVPRICDRQFAYDETIGRARVEVRRRWAAVALGLIDSGALRIEALAQRLLATSVDDDALIMNVRARLNAAGSTMADALGPAAVER